MAVGAIFKFSSEISPSSSSEITLTNQEVVIHNIYASDSCKIYIVNKSTSRATLIYESSGQASLMGLFIHIDSEHTLQFNNNSSSNIYVLADGVVTREV